MMGVLSIVADFDGTLLNTDLPEIVLKRFGTKRWERFDELLSAGKINVEECVIKQYAMIDVPNQEEILKYIDRFIIVREGLDALLSACRDMHVSFVVVSAGLDFCIRRAFHKLGIPLP